MARFRANSIGMMREVGHRLGRLWLRVVDPQRLSEMSGGRVVFEHLRDRGFFAGFEKKRILEIGPKHGEDSLLLAALNPSELVLVELPQKRAFVSEWFPHVSAKCKAVFVEGDILCLTPAQYSGLGMFDLIWCLGVLYHNVEQFRMLKILFDLCNVNGQIVVESATTRNRGLQRLNVVEIHWPTTYRNVPTITHLPSRLALKSWLEMVGFGDVKVWNVYSKTLAWQRAVLTGIRTTDSKPYVGYESRS